MNNKVLIIAGPTAVGKTNLSLELAEKLNGEIISADSVQLYKGMNIGSATPSDEELDRVKHYFINEIDPKEGYDVAQFSKRARALIKDIQSRGKLPIVSGGTGLYVNSIIYDMDFSKQAKDENLRKKLRKDARDKGKEYLHSYLEELDPKAAEKIHQNNVKRVIRALEINLLTGQNMANFKKDPEFAEGYETILVCLKRNRRLLYARINKRVDMMIENGLVDEVKQLKEAGLTEEDIAMKAIGYKEVLGYLNGKYGYDLMIKILKKNTRNFAKRQLTWFRRYDFAHWMDLSKSSEKKISNKIINLVENG